MENKTLNTALTIGAFVIGIIGLIMGIMIMIGNESVIGSAIWLTIVLMGACAAIAILFGLFQLLSNIKGNISLLIGIVGFVVLAIICYSLASDTIMRTYVDITPQVSKVSGAGLLLMYILVLAALAAAIIGEVSRIFK